MGYLQIVTAIKITKIIISTYTLHYIANTYKLMRHWEKWFVRNWQRNNLTYELVTFSRCGLLLLLLFLFSLNIVIQSTTIITLRCRFGAMTWTKHGSSRILRIWKSWALWRSIWWPLWTIRAIRLRLLWPTLLSVHGARSRSLSVRGGILPIPRHSRILTLKIIFKCSRVSPVVSKAWCPVAVTMSHVRVTMRMTMMTSWTMGMYPDSRTTKPKWRTKSKFKEIRFPEHMKVRPGVKEHCADGRWPEHPEGAKRTTKQSWAASKWTTTRETHVWNTHVDRIGIECWVM